MTEDQAHEVDILARSDLWRFERNAICHLFTKVVGVTHRNRDGTNRRKILEDCVPAERLLLAHEPENPKDPNAVMVIRETHEQIGYLRAQLAQAVVALIKRSYRFEVIITSITGEESGIIGANLLLVVAPPSVSAQEVMLYLNKIPPEEIFDDEIVLRHFHGWKPA